MTDEAAQLSPLGRMRRRLLRMAGIGAVAVGAGSILSYGDSSASQRSGRFGDALPSAIANPRSDARIVYNTHTPETVSAVLKRYLRAYPDEHIQLVNLSGTDAIRRVIAERSQPVGDVWVHAHATDLPDLAAQGILRTHRSERTPPLPERYRDDGGRWYAVGLRPRVLAYNRRVLQAAGVGPPASVLGLLERTWRANKLGEWTGDAIIGLPDPLQPSTLAWLASLFAGLGKEEAERFVNGVFNQGAGIPGSTADLLEAIRSERYAIGPVEGADVIRAVRGGGTEIGFAYVEQDTAGKLPGSWASPTAVALLKDTPEAHQLMEFLLSTEVATSFVQEGFEFPARTDLAVPDTHSAPNGGLRLAPQAVRDMAPAMEEARQSLRAWLG